MFWQGALLKMVVWKEHEHELDEIHGSNDHGTMASIRECGFLKLFKVPSMRAQLRLLEHILRKWNLEEQNFEVGAHILMVEVKDIYILTSLSRRGATISLTGPCDGEVTTQGLID